LAAMKWLGASPATQIANVVHQHAEWARIAELDLHYEDMIADLHQAARHVSAALGFKEREINFNAIAREVESLQSPIQKDWKYDPISLMHRNHRPNSYVEPVPLIEAEIHLQFSAWQAAHRYT